MLTGFKMGCWTGIPKFKADVLFCHNFQKTAVGVDESLKDFAFL